MPIPPPISLCARPRRKTWSCRPPTIGRRSSVEVDLASAFWMVHPSAIYLHEGQQYFVQELESGKNGRHAHPRSLWITTPKPAARLEIQVLTESGARCRLPGGEKGWGEIQVTTQVVGFKKLRWFTQENLGEEPLDTAPDRVADHRLLAFAFRMKQLTALRLSGAWTNDPNDYGPGLAAPPPRGPDARWIPLPGLRCARERPRTRGAPQDSLPIVHIRLRRQTGWIISSRFARPAIARPNRTSASAPAWPACRMCSASLRRCS